MQRITVISLLVAASAGFYAVSSSDENSTLLAVLVLSLALGAALLTHLRARSKEREP